MQYRRSTRVRPQRKAAAMVVIEEAVLARIVAAARAAPALEVCGLLLGAGARITAARPAANLAATPERAFEIAPATLFATLRAERSGGPALLGYYHSHPGGDPLPSRCDAAAAAADGRLWLILGQTRGGLWRAMPDGAIAGRFDPVDWASAGAQGLHDMPALFRYGTIGDGARRS